MPRVSIIMATYNCQNTVSISIESILKQTYQDWEFIICDDCSTDNTYAILTEYQSRFPEKFVLLRNEQNSKLPYSLNRCLEHSSGEYIARMDADDESLPERLEKQVRFLDEHPDMAVVGTSMVRVDSNQVCHEYKAVAHPDRYTAMREVPFCHATILMRKSVYDDLGGYVVSKRTERGQDMDLWFRFYEKGYNGDNLQEPLYRYLEDRQALKRRKFKYCVYITHTRLIGFKRLGYPLHKYYLAFHPIISHFVPRKLKLWWRKEKAVNFKDSKY